MKALMLIGLLAITPAAAGEPKYLLPEPYTDENGAVIYPDPVPVEPVPAPRYEREFEPPPMPPPPSRPPPALYREPYYQPRGVEVYEARREERKYYRRKRFFDAAHQMLDIMEALAR